VAGGDGVDERSRPATYVHGRTSREVFDGDGDSVSWMNLNRLHEFERLARKYCDGVQRAQGGTTPSSTPKTSGTIVKASAVTISTNNRLSPTPARAICPMVTSPLL